MSELKAFDVGLGQYCKDGSPCVVAFDADLNPRLLNEKVYIKSEADKVIAEQNKRYFELQDTAIKIDEELTETKKQLRHQKYKRCLAMAWWCESENYTACWYHENSERCEWTEKWHKRWLELAEKFKEAK